MTAKRIINGTWGKVYLDGNLVAECDSFKAVSKYTKEAVNMCGKMEEDNKITGVQNTGNIRLKKVFSRMASLIGDKVSNGQDVRFTVISALEDPDAFGKESIQLSDVSFDDLTLMDWEAAKTNTTDVAFTFGKFKFLDKIEVR